MTSRDRLVLAILAVAGVMAALWFFVVTPKRDEAKAVTVQVTAAEKRRDTANEEAAVAEQAKLTYHRDYATVARLGKAVPVKADVPSLVYQLETAARAARVDFRSITVQSASATAPASPANSLTPDAAASPAAAGGSAAAPGSAAAGTPDASKRAAASPGIVAKAFQFTFNGHFVALRRLLAEIDRFSRVRGSKVSVSGRLLTVDAVSMNPSAKGLPNIRAEIKANAYVADLPAALPGSSLPQASGGATASTTTTASQPGP
jgi:hypothetical protein